MKDLLVTMKHLPGRPQSIATANGHPDRQVGLAQAGIGQDPLHIEGDADDAEERIRAGPGIGQKNRGADNQPGIALDQGHRPLQRRSPAFNDPADRRPLVGNTSEIHANDGFIAGQRIRHGDDGTVAQRHGDDVAVTFEQDLGEAGEFIGRDVAVKRDLG